MQVSGLELNSLRFWLPTPASCPGSSEANPERSRLIVPHLRVPKNTLSLRQPKDLSPWRIATNRRPLGHTVRSPCQQPVPVASIFLIQLSFTTFLSSTLDDLVCCCLPTSRRELLSPAAEAHQPRPSFPPSKNRRVKDPALGARIIGRRFLFLLPLASILFIFSFSPLSPTLRRLVRLLLEIPHLYSSLSLSNLPGWLRTNIQRTFDWCNYTRWIPAASVAASNLYSRGSDINTLRSICPGQFDLRHDTKTRESVEPHRRNTEHK